MITQNAGYIIKKAYQHASLINLGATPSTVQYAEGIDRLNDVVNILATQGLKLWLQEELTLTLTSGKTTYSVGPSGDLNMVRPLTVFQAFYQGTSGYRQPLTILSRDEWTRLAQVGVAGAVNSFFPDRQLTYLYINLYNTPDATAATGTVHLIARTAPPSYVLTTDTSGFPPEWYMLLQWMLAEELADGQPQEVQQRCASHAAAYKAALEAFDVEDASTKFQPDPRSMYYGSSFR